MDTSPNMKDPSPFVSTSMASFESPKNRPRPNWRRRDNSLTFDEDSTVKEKKIINPSGSGSGFAMNSALFDGTGWVTEKNLHADQIRTLYRNNFNQPKPFHKAAIKGSDNKPKRKILVFDPEG